MTGAGKEKWWAGSVERITDNEKYMGDALLQKTYTEDYLTKKRVKNEGQLQQLYVKDCVEPIIPRKIQKWNILKVWIELAQRWMRSGFGQRCGLLRMTLQVLTVHIGKFVCIINRGMGFSKVKQSRIRQSSL